MILGLIFGASFTQLLIAIAFSYFFIRAGLGVLRGMAAPIPEPPPSGELRKVKIQFRCPICGTEVRMTASTDEDPEPPRHCMQEMDLVAPLE